MQVVCCWEGLFDKAILLSHGDGSLYTGALGWWHQDGKVGMVAPGCQHEYGIKGYGDGSIGMKTHH